MSVLVLAASLLWTGCGKAEKKPVAAKPAEAPAVDISTLQEFLRYPGAKATERIQISTDDSKGTAWTLVSDDPRAKVEDWYRASCEKAGWVKDPECNKVGMLELVNNDRTETIKMMVCEKDGKSYISITHGLK
jgi:hypothetical protein